MKLSATNYLVCLDCQSGLKLAPGYTMDPNHAAEVFEGYLTCDKCNNRYHIKKGVPRFVDTERSKPEDIQTGKNFAEEWRRFNRMDTRYKQQFFDWVYPVDEAFFKNKVVLECGCGKGRHAKIASESGVKDIFAVDIGEAIDVAYENVGHMPGINLVQADIEHMPFTAEFDFAFSVGVLHHMESPIHGFVAMASKVKPEGSVLAWVYGRENNRWLIRVVNPIRVNCTSRLNPSILMALSAMLAAPLTFGCKFVAKPWGQLQKKMPFLPRLFYQDYLAYIASFDFNEIHHIVYDHLVAPVANYVAQDYFRQWFVEAKRAEPVLRWHNRNSWTGFTSGDPLLLSDMRSKVKSDLPAVHK